MKLEGKMFHVIYDRDTDETIIHVRIKGYSKNAFNESPFWDNSVRVTPVTERRKPCPDTCDCLCHDVGGGPLHPDEPCPGKS